MLLQYVPPFGGHFATTTSAVGMSDEAARAMQSRGTADARDDFVLLSVHDACCRLAQVQPAGRC